MAACNIGYEAIDLLLQLFIQRKMNSLLSDANLKHLATLLEGKTVPMPEQIGLSSYLFLLHAFDILDVIFESHPAYTKEELEVRKKKAVEIISNSVPAIVNKLMGGQIATGCVTLLEILQHSHYNKHLCYNLLDLVICEMFPHVNK